MSEETERLRAGLRKIADLHGPDRSRMQEIEEFHDDGPCPDGSCAGHCKDIRVCGECGTDTHPEFDVWFFPWPCPTFEAAADVLGLPLGPQPRQGAS